MLTVIRVRIDRTKGTNTDATVVLDCPVSKSKELNRDATQGIGRVALHAAHQTSGVPALETGSAMSFRKSSREQDPFPTKASAEGVAQDSGMTV